MFIIASASRSVDLQYIRAGGFVYLFIYLFMFVFLAFLGPLLRHMEVPRLGVESEL